MEQLERIAAMEERLDKATLAVTALSDALAAYEAGKIPKTWNRGVLSEDGVFDVLMEITRLQTKMATLSNT